jgi:hypothetical protein
VDKRKTANENIFIIDDELVQVKTLHKDKFARIPSQDLSFVDFMQTYINWEKNYLEETFSFNINSNVVFLKSTKGRDIAFWTYDMPLGQSEQRTDSSVTTPTQKQLFVLARVKDYLVGINSPIFEENNFDSIKNYLLSNIDGIVESQNEIDVDALSNQLNK